MFIKMLLTTSYQYQKRIAYWWRNFKTIVHASKLGAPDHNRNYNYF